jgi:phosphoglycerol transferase MdoB-like AlkP superfamily enzyme
MGLPDLLRQRGYATLSVHGYQPAFWKRDVNHPRLGIDKMYFQNQFEYRKLGLGVPDVEFFEQSVPFLEEQRQPFFAFMISLSSHHPYNVLPPGHVGIDIDLPRSMARNYLRSVHYADAALGRFIETIKTNGIYQRSILIIYGDHIAPMDKTSRDLLEQKIGVNIGAVREQRIPFLLLIPGQEETIDAHRKLYEPVVGGLQDVLPTVLHLVGAEIPLGVYGVHLFLENSRRPVIPFFKKANGLVVDGILFDAAEARPVIDETGPLFIAGGGGLALKGKALEEAYLQAARDVLAHRIMFDFDLQQRLREQNQEE